MTDTIGQERAAIGAPEVTPDPRDDGFEVGRPRLGGREFPVELSARQVAVLNAAADTMIPPGEGFPAPSEVAVVDFIGRYLTPDDEEPLYFPFAREREFKARVDALGDAFVSARPDERVELLKGVEQDEADFFTALLNLVYYGYYSAPSVTLAIQANLPAGRDYHGPPQPYGYLRTIERWEADEETFAARGGGHHIATKDVERLDLSKVPWLNKRR